MGGKNGGRRKKKSRPVSRILSLNPDSHRDETLIIYLRLLLPKAFSCLPSGNGRAILNSRYTWHCTA